MLIRGAMAMMFALALTRPLQADLHHSGGCSGASERLPAAETLVCRPGWPVWEESVGAKSGHGAILRLIAIYTSLGHRDGAEILIAQLRAQGVSEEILSEATTWTKLHGSSPAPQYEPRKLSPAERGWETTQ